MKQVLIFGALIAAALSASTPVLAADHYAAWDEARIKEDQQKYPFLYPGFRFLIQPVAQGGQSIAAVYDGDGGFSICISGQNPSNEAIPAAFHCNFREGAPAIHVPADVVFGKPDKKTKVKNFLKSLTWAGLAGLSANTEFPLASALGQTGANLTEQSPSSPIISQIQYSKTMSKIQLYAKKAHDKCDANPAAVLAPYSMSDLTEDLSSRLNDFFKKCAGYGIDLSGKSDVYNPQLQAKVLSDLDPENIAKNGIVNEDKNDEVFCHEQEMNQEMAVIVGSTCNIQSVTPQAGETGNAELWFPGQPVSSSCKDALLHQVAIDPVTGKPLLDPNGQVYHIGAPAAAWAYYQSQKVKNIAPTTTDEATAEQVGACLQKNPKVAADTQTRLQESYTDALNLPTTPDSPPASETTTTASPAVAAPASGSGPN